MEKETNVILVKKAMKHDHDAFTSLIKACATDLYRTAIAILKNDDDAGDAIQDTVLTCWEKIGTLKNPEYFKTWLTRILINKCYDILKFQKRVVPLDDSYEGYKVDEYNLELKEALSRLDEKYSLPLMLFYGEGYKIEEIAHILDIPKSTVSTRLQRGRERLRNYYFEEGVEQA